MQPFCHPPALRVRLPHPGALTASQRPGLLRDVQAANRMSEVVISLQPVAVTREVAAAALGMGITMFSERVQPELKVIRCGSKVLVPVTELRRWVQENAERVL